ncbi:DNA repair protein RAD51 homolog 4 [Linum perenne]
MFNGQNGPRAHRQRPSSLADGFNFRFPRGRSFEMKSMAALKSLEREFPLLDCDFQSFCASHGIHTVSDFLLHDLNLLAASAGDHPRLNEGIEQVLSIVDALHHQPWLDGEEMLRDALNNKRVLSTGLLGLDSFLNGGLRIGQLTELVGQSSSGKTQFCLRIASSVAKMDKSNVVYIDTGNSFSSKLIEQFVRESDRISVVQRVMSRILCHSVFDVFLLFDVLHQLDIRLKSRESREDREVRLLVIDSISSLITPVLGGSSSQGHGLMASLGVLLKKLAHEYNIAILVTNHMVGGEGGSLKPALGESWKSIPHVRLLLSRDHRTNACNISTLKHPSLASGGSAIFTIE